MGFAYSLWSPFPYGTYSNLTDSVSIIPSRHIRFEGEVQIVLPNYGLFSSSKYVLDTSGIFNMFVC